MKAAISYILFSAINLLRSIRALRSEKPVFYGRLEIGLERFDRKVLSFGLVGGAFDIGRERLEMRRTRLEIDVIRFG